MTASGSPALWDLAELAGIVPAPPDDTLAALLSSWWGLPRTFGCEGARQAARWTVVAPSPLILCPDCALTAFDTVRVCAYLIFEMNANVKVLGRAHRHCAERARKRS
jgi:hypothetical protein